MSSETERIEAEIAQRREHLAGTVEQLSNRVAQQKQQAKRGLLVTGGVIAAVLVVALVVRQVRS